MKEFDIIKHFFSAQAVKRKDVILGIGDDCAVITVPEHKNLLVTTDTLVAGVHFPHNTAPRAIGHKAIAVNLSDLAAMGAQPSWLSIAITIPEVDESWLSEFCQGAFELCDYFNVQVIGGDTTQGPLSITITAQGLTPIGKHIVRSGAQVGDWIYVTGELGDAALALQHINGDVNVNDAHKEQVFKKLEFPMPRILAGQTLQNYASAAIDISDGLLADLNHICQASSVGANLMLDAMPLSLAIKDNLAIDDALTLALSGGDDYELLFTVSENKKIAMETALSDAGTQVTCIGQINASDKISATQNNVEVALTHLSGFEHFTDTAEVKK